MAPRLQATCRPEGRLDLSLWGAGRLGVLRFSPLAGPYVYSPNRFEAARGGLEVAQSAPALVLRRARYRRFYPARTSAWWARPLECAAPVARSGAHRSVVLPWGVVLIEMRGDDLVVAVGADMREAQAGLAMTADAIAAEARAYAAACDALPEADPVLRTMVSQGVHAALSSRRRDELGAFAGLAAGLAYSAPARTYYRDGYWTLLALLTLDPETVGRQIDLLAGGIQPDGEAPSAVIVSGSAQAEAWERLRRGVDRVAAQHHRPGEWWSDHFDSPLFFVLAAGDLARATGDDSRARRWWPKIAAVFERYAALAAACAGLPRKPRNDRDWADNVYRSGAVAYDLGLWFGALEAVARLGAAIDPPIAARATVLAATGRRALDEALLGPDGWYADYASLEGFTEDHLALDSLTLLRHGAVSPERADAVLAAVAARLDSRANHAQRWGDWGMLCAWPPFKRRGDLYAKSAFPLRYHNGADWPWLDGLYAGERLRRGLPGWRYPLTRWWETCLARGWLGAVEYFSPPFGRGSLLQGWSSLPAAVALEHRGRVLAGDAG